MELLLAVCLEDFDGDIRRVADEYEENEEFRRRIDIGARQLAAQPTFRTTETIH